MERLRVLTDLSARELASLAGLHASHIRRIERGDIKQITATTLRAIAGVFGVPLGWLLSGDSEPPPTETVQRAVARSKRRARSGTVAA